MLFVAVDEEALLAAGGAGTANTPPLVAAAAAAAAATAAAPEGGLFTTILSPKLSLDVSALTVAVGFVTVVVAAIADSAAKLLLLGSTANGMARSTWSTPSDAAASSSSRLFSLEGLWTGVVAQDEDDPPPFAVVST